MHGRIAEISCGEEESRIRSRCPLGQSQGTGASPMGLSNRLIMKPFKNGRYKSAIIELLQTDGDANTQQIAIHLIERFRHGPTMPQVTNILAKCEHFTKVMDGNKPRIDTVKEGWWDSYKVFVWTLKDRKAADLYLRNLREATYRGRGRPKIAN